MPPPHPDHRVEMWCCFGFSVVTCCRRRFRHRFAWLITSDRTLTVRLGVARAWWSSAGAVEPNARRGARVGSAGETECGEPRAQVDDGGQVVGSLDVAVGRLPQPPLD
ncbi:hypothetical protein Aglo01_32030 [Actinokineospora globicatena]|nr:hypothetical protein Aglo01_32030 [Actinokineospora globicatena]GLW84611.1 hypothetical protein Aglo02_22510 [Actinokineospora globicatena]